ncbi:thioredoxin family protein [Terrimonas sp. NA20]|uniref:Thioredoxin family protein n=1 Tax=Terrimonas ginsenosidimutans TaxID=2908004 RepID=A0ABS9KYL1_9BACT|nr:thioredoxin family protein [Terrimonas ginsenosidimutans]MCG2617425.1 thioredoxin family protein [Terrimonas ginsenosidimutans]
MMKKCILALSIFICASAAQAQDLSKFNLYKPDEDAEKAIAKTVKDAKAAGKQVFIQIGGNWCIWCLRFNDFVKTDKSIDSIVNQNYIVYHLNYSKENSNSKLLAKYGFPQRFGFPVFLVLDGNGKLLHTQNSSYLESGKTYDADKVKGFFLDWTKKSLDPAEYKEK